MGVEVCRVTGNGKGTQVASRMLSMSGEVFLGITSRDPSVSKSNWLHVDMMHFSVFSSLI